MAVSEQDVEISLTQSPEPFRLRLCPAQGAGLTAYRMLAAEGDGSPFQASDFVAAWMDAVRGGRSELVLLIAEDGEGVAAVLPLDVTRIGPLRLGRLPGATHANLGGPLWRRTARRGPLVEPAALASAVLDSVARIDALILERLPETGFLGGGARVEPSLEERFAITLEGGLEGVIGRGNAKRKRKKFRQQQRHFDMQGGYRFGQVPASGTRAALDTFRALKRARFAALDMPDPFAEPGIDRFLHALFDDGGARFRLYTVECGGSIKAMMGGIADRGTFFGMFSAFADDEDADVSPGELLLWHLVESLAAEGFARLDLGPGEERYKRSWCDLVVSQSDALVAVTPLGRAYLLAAALGRGVKTRVKRDARLRAGAQRLRRLLQRA